jgi:hypothetical protein
MSSFNFSQKIVGRLPFSSVFLRSSFNFSQKIVGRLPFSSVFLRSSSNFFLGRISSWVKIRLHTENQLARLSGSALKVLWVGWWLCGVVVGGGLHSIMGSHQLCFWVEVGL